MIPVKEYFALLRQYLRPQWKRVLLLAFLLFTGIGLQLWMPQIVRQFIDVTQNTGVETAVLTQTAVLFLIVTLANQLFKLGAAYMTELVKWRATNWLRQDLADHCLQLDMAFHNDQTPGQMIEKIDGDVAELSNFFSQFVLRVVGNLILLVGILFLLFREHWLIGTAYVLYAVVMLPTLVYVTRFGVPFWKKKREVTATMFGLLEEWLGGTEDIRASGGVGYVVRRLQEVTYQLYLVTRKAFTLGELTWTTSIFFSGIGHAIALGIGAYLLLQGEITIGTVYLFFHYANMLHWPIDQLARELQNLQSATASIQRIQELLKVQPSILDGERVLDRGERPLSVTFSHVQFSYNGQDQILHDVDFTLEAGQILGLLGRTGSGKSTLTRLLFRLYDPQQGVILFDGVDVRQLTIANVRQSVGMVTQEVQLFQASVRDNLTFFNSAIPDEAIYHALEQLGLQAWLNRLPKGLDTILMGGGKGLSAGEAQLLAFTRVFLQNPRLIILDEASSRLDPVTEQLIEQALDKLLAGRTAVIVAHRLATVQRADQILIMSDGAILEHGNRTDLLADNNSHFAQLLRVGLEATV